MEKISAKLPKKDHGIFGKRRARSDNLFCFP